ncbi:hypothetical protein GPECTOR_8g141 [Gonium pectorale]|uniref:HP domain-containing protein n=1 Tax=Gonium pectorale TaxID=33097 RepID=A0A150GTS4_GONPE|nr:hypothetical protein GPECTOR_8g141 [Gonium pectorale]|eukprot:KXZ52750.1 hypothetical protein GPECTOR_8g141 [Gonium pectorale]
MTQEEAEHAAATNGAVKASPGKVEVPISEQDDGVAVVAAPSEPAKGDVGEEAEEVPEELAAGGSAESKATEESLAPAEVPPASEPVTAEQATDSKEPEPAPAPEALTEENPAPAESVAPEPVPAPAPVVAEEAEAPAAMTVAVAPPPASPAVKPIEPDETAPSANGTSTDPAPEDAPEVPQPGTVQELTKRLSSTSLQSVSSVPHSQTTTPVKAVSSEKQQASVPVAAAAVLGARAPVKSPSGVLRSGEASPSSTHDTKNTINVSQLLKLGAFKMQPLKDFVPYAELQRLRVEDGIDATRKEDYLNDAEFKEVFGMDRDTFKKQPAWRQAQAKKKSNLY